MREIMECLIVAAGMGTRLKTFGEVKPLVEVRGKPLIEHAIKSAVAAGVEKFVVITGYQAQLVEDCLAALAADNGWVISTVRNPDYKLSNGLSVLLGEEKLRGEFYLAMCDHVVEPKIYDRLSAAALPQGAVGLAVDRRLDNPDVDLLDVTKVRLAGELIAEIGKEIPLYNAFDAGIFRANASLFSAIRTSRADTGDCSISGGMRVLSTARMAYGVDIGASRWIDVDSPAMLARAEQAITSFGGGNSDHQSELGTRP